MSDYIILKSIALKPEHISTGRTHHYQGDEELPSASILKIAKYEDSGGFYLLYFDANEKELTDTFHDTIEAALDQAAWEYEVKPNEWTTVN